MNKNTRNRKRGVPRAKIALIGILVVVLVAVWGNAFLGSGPASVSSRGPTTPAPQTPRAGANRQTTAPKAQPTGDAERSPVVDWPTIPLDQAVLNDPFAKPTWAIPPQTAGSTSPSRRSGGDNEARRTLQQQRATMVILTGDAKVAAIGDREVRVGDFLNGHQVIDITRDGIVVANQPTAQ